MGQKKTLNVFVAFFCINNYLDLPKACHYHQHLSLQRHYPWLTKTCSFSQRPTLQSYCSLKKDLRLNNITCWITTDKDILVEVDPVDPLLVAPQTQHLRHLFQMNVLFCLLALSYPYICIGLKIKISVIFIYHLSDIN